MAASLGCIATFGIAVPADAQLPGVGADLHIAGQADGAIREGQSGGESRAERMSRISERTGGTWGLRFGGKPDIRFWLVETLLAANPTW